MVSLAIINFNASSSGVTPLVEIIRPDSVILLMYSVNAVEKVVPGSGVGGFVKGTRVGSGNGSGLGVGEFVEGTRVGSGNGSGLGVGGVAEGVPVGVSVGNIMLPVGVGNGSGTGLGVGSSTFGDGSISLPEEQFPCPQYTPTLTPAARTAMMTINAITLMYLRRVWFDDVNFLDSASASSSGVVEDANGTSIATSSLLRCVGHSTPFSGLFLVVDMVKNNKMRRRLERREIKNTNQRK